MKIRTGGMVLAAWVGCGGQTNTQGQDEGSGSEVTFVAGSGVAEQASGAASGNASAPSGASSGAVLQGSGVSSGTRVSASGVSSGNAPVASGASSGASTGQDVAVSGDIGSTDIPDAGSDTSDALAEAQAATDGGPPQGLVSVAPSASHFGWQTLQTDFMRDGVSCTGRVTLSVSDHAVCYESASDQLMCAGFTYQTTYGTSFVATGQAGVDQVLLSPTANSNTGNAACIHKTTGEVLCVGDYNPWGQFASGDTMPSSDWVAWDGAARFAHIATGTWDQMCALDPTGAAVCSGYAYGTEVNADNQAYGTLPESVSSSQVSSLWVDTAGMAQPNDPAVFRASDGRSSCTITSAGLGCSEVDGDSNYTQPGTVAGGPVATDDSEYVCFVDDAGAAWCADPNLPLPPFRVFQNAGNIVYLSTNYYSTDVCAVSADGAIWCFGGNMNGELGTGDMNAVTAAVRVQPPGSAMIGCP